MDKIFSARNVAKFVVSGIIHGKTAQLTENTIADHTQFDNDDLVVEITGNVAGWYISHKLKPHTDRMVDQTADFIAEKRAKRNAKKDPTK